MQSRQPAARFVFAMGVSAGLSYWYNRNDLFRLFLEANAMATVLETAPRAAETLMRISR